MPRCRSGSVPVYRGALRCGHGAPTVQWVLHGVATGVQWVLPGVATVLPLYSGCSPVWPRCSHCTVGAPRCGHGAPTVQWVLPGVATVLPLYSGCSPVWLRCSHCTVGAPRCGHGAPRFSLGLSRSFGTEFGFNVLCFPSRARRCNSNWLVSKCA